MSKDKEIAAGLPDTGRAGVVVRAGGVVAVAAAGAMVVALSVRPITSFDIGYHLAYGEHFLKTGRIVQTNEHIYTRFDQAPPGRGLALGPGCRYDAESNTYSFVNANWLSQVILAAVRRIGGWTGLSIFRALLLAAIFAAVVVTMRAGRLSWSWVAVGLILAGLTAYERFALRPELFGYLVLLVQWALLARPRFGPRQAVAVILLQVLAVNLHSYWLLGIALTGAMLADALLRWLWRRTVTQEGACDLVPRLKWLGIAAGGLFLAAACNPWLLRGAVFPAQTLTYLREHDVIGLAKLTPDSHPWAMIGELVPSVSEAMLKYRCTLAYIGVLALAGAAAVVAAVRQRWGWLLVLAGIAAVSFQTRRNMALGGLILAPLSLIALADGWRRLRPKVAGPAADMLSGGLSAAVALACIALGVFWTVSIVNNRFYFSRRRYWRFGLGASKLMIPLESAWWINRHKPPGRLWCDFSGSANLAYLTGREVPLLTNTWAYPPYVMKRNVRIAGVRKTLEKAPEPPAEFQRLVGEYGVGTVALRYLGRVPPLVGELNRSPDWAVAHVGVKEIVFIRRTGPTAAMADDLGLTERGFDVAGYIDRAIGADPVPAFALHGAASLLYELEWRQATIQVFRKCVDDFDPEYHEALWGLGKTLTEYGAEKASRIDEFLKQKNPGEAKKARRAALEAWKEARRRFEKTAQLKSGYGKAEEYAELLRQQIHILERGAAGTGRGE